MEWKPVRGNSNQQEDEDLLPVMKRSQSCPDLEKPEDTEYKKPKSYFDQYFGENGQDNVYVEFSIISKQYAHDMPDHPLIVGANPLPLHADAIHVGALINFVYKDDIYGRRGILERAGYEVKQEYDAKRLQVELPYFGYGMTKTGAGQLRCKAIFHVEVFEESQQYIQDATYRVLRRAQTDGIKLIYDVERQCIPQNKEYLDSHQHINEAFWKVDDFGICDKLRSPDEDQDYKDAETAKRRGYICEIITIPMKGISEAYGSDVTLKLYKGSITKLENTNCIVNFVYTDDIYGRMGIIQAAGEPIMQEYDARRLQVEIKYVAYGVVMTTAGRLPYKAIFHVLIFEELAKFKSAIQRALRSAEKECMRSIAFPALDCSTHKNYVDGYLQIFYEFEKKEQPRCLHMIDIICPNEKEYEYHGEAMKIRGEKLNLS